jgi:hypothetical protein
MSYKIAAVCAAFGFTVYALVDSTLRYQQIRHEGKIKKENFNKLLERIDYFDRNNEHKKRDILLNDLKNGWY